MLSISVYVVEPKIDYLKKKVLNDYRVLSTTSFPKCNSIPLIYHQKDKKIHWKSANMKTHGKF